jgi:hypothetical protein
MAPVIVGIRAALPPDFVSAVVATAGGTLCYAAFARAFGIAAEERDQYLD